ncbi:hypothetical protein ACFVSN_43980 [Kitasatospora sp. NPDC057904]|uniref:hypothetical protein n=1 Tax=Kitasatospora sp. NPDC057904 TaxID=3346275 RepID=UPI0036D906CD
MRRLVTTIGTLAAAGLLALAIPTSAQAATGALAFYNVVGNKTPTVTFLDPESSCYEVPVKARGPVSGAHNATNSVVDFYLGEGCSGTPHSLRPGGWLRFNLHWGPGSFRVES